MFFSTPTLSSEELNLRFNFNAKAFPFKPVISLGLNLDSSGIYHPVEPESYFHWSNIIIPYKFVALFPALDLEYKS